MKSYDTATNDDWSSCHPAAFFSFFRSTFWHFELFFFFVLQGVLGNIALIWWGAEAPLPAVHHWHWQSTCGWAGQAEDDHCQEWPWHRQVSGVFPSSCTLAPPVVHLRWLQKRFRALHVSVLKIALRFFTSTAKWEVKERWKNAAWLFRPYTFCGGSFQRL